MSDNAARSSSIATDNFRHLSGDEARSHNITAAREVADLVRSTLGPKGLDKLLVSSGGSVTVTNDGETVLKTVDVDHPAARAVVEVAKSQAEQVGDGTTTATVLASELLRAADELLDQGIHPTVVVNGYQRTIDHAMDELDDMASPVEVDDELLRRIATSTLTGKAVTPHVDDLTPLVLDTTAAITVENAVDLEYLDIRSRAGRAVSDSYLCRGAVLDEEPCHDSMATELSDATVLLLQRDFDVPEPETDVRAEIDDAEQWEGFLDRADRRVTEAIGHVTELDVDAVLCHARVDDRIAALLAERGVLAVEHVKRGETDFDLLQEVTDATPVSTPLEATSTDLGRATISRDGSFAIENPNTHGVTLVACGPTPHTVAEVERSLSNAIDAVARTVTDGRILVGGGASEVELASRVRAHAPQVGGRSQLAVESFADAIEAVPRTLATNAGFDPIDTLVELRAAHAAGREHAGVDLTTGEIENTLETGVVQPAYVLEQALYNAAKAASIILKIDGVLSAAESTNQEETSSEGSRR